MCTAHLHGIFEFCSQLINVKLHTFFSTAIDRYNERPADQYTVSTKCKCLETKENLVYSKLGLYPRGLDDLQRETGLTPQEVMGICVSLQLKGCIQERSKNYYVRAK